MIGDAIFMRKILDRRCQMPGPRSASAAAAAAAATTIPLLWDLVKRARMCASAYKAVLSR